MHVFCPCIATKSNVRKTSRDIAGKNTKVDYLNTHCINAYSVFTSMFILFDACVCGCVCVCIERSPLATRSTRDGRIFYEISFVSFLAIQFNLRLLFYFDLLLQFSLCRMWPVLLAESGGEGERDRDRAGRNERLVFYLSTAFHPTWTPCCALCAALFVYWFG